MNWIIKLDEIDVPREILAMVPESVARSNMVMPIGMEFGDLQLALSDSCENGLVEKLSFVLNLTIRPFRAFKEQICLSIDRHYSVLERLG